MSTYKTVDKSLGYRVFELAQSTQVINDSVESVRSGKLHQLIPLYGQLRSLLAEKSSQNESLLLDISEQLDHQLEFYCMPGIDREIPNFLKEDLIIHLSGFPVTLKKERSNQQLINMKDFLDKKILLYKERDYAPRDLIAFFANKAGGSHYSTKLPQDFKELLSFRLFGQEALSNALLQIGELTLNLTLNLLKQIADIEMHLSLFLPKQKITEKGFIFDFDYPNSNMRIFAYLNSLKELRFGVVGINGYEVIIICEQTIDWSKPHHLNFKLFIEDNVTSTLEIFVDGQKVASKNIPQPLILANDPFHYNVYYNRSSQSVNHSMSVGVNQIVMYGSHHNKSEHAQMVSHFKESLSEDQIDLIYFKKGSYGIQASGDKNIKMHGSVLKSNMRKLIKSQSQE